MKKYVFLFIVVNTFSFSCLAQSSNTVSENSKIKSTSSVSNEGGVVSYHVVEKIGGNITTYDVSNLSLVDSYELGANNTRVVTPNYRKIKIKKTGIVANKEELKAPVVKVSEIITVPIIVKTSLAPVPVADPIKAAINSSVKKNTFVIVDILCTYERILDKGEYESTEMLKKVGDMRYFKGDLVVAYKWYSQLFALTTDFDKVYYYRYSQALKAVGQLDKANEMMKIFENKILSKE